MKQKVNKVSNKEGDIIMISKMYLKYIYSIKKWKIHSNIHRTIYFSREIKANIKNLYTKISKIYLLRYDRFKFALDGARRI